LKAGEADLRNFDQEDQKVEIVYSEHNHQVIKERRKKGFLKAIKDEN
jgi:hypothetical protein